jgi:hypothetical protein
MFPDSAKSRAYQTFPKSLILLDLAKSAEVIDFVGVRQICGPAKRAPQSRPSPVTPPT